MQLSDVVGGSGLSGYAMIAMILFMVAFVAIVVRLFWPSRREREERKRHLPFDEMPRRGPGDPE